MEQPDTQNNWYVISIQSGKEKEIGDILRAHKTKFNINEIIIPEAPDVEEMEDCTFLPDDIRAYRFLSGYIFIKAFLTQKIYQEICGFECVYKFLGSFVYNDDNRRIKYRPSPITMGEIKTIRQILLLELPEPKESESSFQLDDLVEIKSGDFSSVKGKIVEITNAHVKILPDSIFKNLIKVGIDNISPVLKLA